MMEIEDWLDYNPDTGELVFKRSNSKGRKWNRSHPNKIAGNLDEKGYIRLWYEGRHQRAHRIIALKFIPNPDNKPEINHKNGIKHDNRLNNLEWCTTSENIQHSFDTGLNVGIKRDCQVNMKISSEDVETIRKVFVKGSKTYGARALAREYNVSHTCILNALKGALNS